MKIVAKVRVYSGSRAAYDSRRQTAPPVEVLESARDSPNEPPDPPHDPDPLQPETDNLVPPDMEPETMARQERYRSLKFLFYAGGIFLAYFVYGILQEKVTKGKYPEEIVENGTEIVVYEDYTDFQSLVFIQCLLSFVVASAELLFRRDGIRHSELLFFGTALAYVLAMVWSNMALQWVAYPTQVIGKSAKPIPVLILNVLVGRKSYNWKKYLFVFLIVVGVVLFMFKDQKKDDAGWLKERSFGWGEILLLLSLIMDGLLGAMQEIMRRTTNPSSVLMMMRMNMWSCVFLIIGLLYTGEVFHFVRFVARHPYVLTNILLLATVGTVGQHFIYLMVSGFGSLPLSIVTTIRKFFTILASVLIFQNALLPRQWGGAVIVFGALILDAYYSKSAAPTSNS